ncbi:MAG: hypothetical protein ACK4N5_08705 [Myxococcales bacterium]
MKSPSKAGAALLARASFTPVTSSDGAAVSVAHFGEVAEPARWK